MSVSSSTSTPSSPATTGLATVIVGSEAVSAPARNADCWKIIPVSATSSQGTNSGEVSTPTRLCSDISTTPLVSTANSASDEPATTASSTGANGLPAHLRAATTQATSTGTMTRATITQMCSGARCLPDAGSPTMITTARAAARISAHAHSRGLIRWWASRA
ncbi:hypothetical protein PICSAR55_01389 [Mycobacterium avium subsp. paratuberculosis]|nr:hypothetical protein PICSAR55_01389 [Mycobacterium avium subsp. paratuberculosis]